MKNICIFALLNINNSCATLSKQKEMKVEKMVIAFQDFFKNDTVSISLNDCQLFENKVLNSIKEMIEKGKRSFAFEVQQRAVEYSAFQNLANNLKSEITSNIPLAKNTVVEKK